jgi:hypothetical protein
MLRLSQSETLSHFILDTDHLPGNCNETKMIARQSAKLQAIAASRCLTRISSLFAAFK